MLHEQYTHICKLQTSHTTQKVCVKEAQTKPAHVITHTNTYTPYHTPYKDSSSSTHVLCHGTA